MSEWNSLKTIKRTPARNVLELPGGILKENPWGISEKIPKEIHVQNLEMLSNKLLN